MLDVVCWLWTPTKEYRSQFCTDHANTLYSMVQRHYPHEFRFSCISDRSTGFDKGIRVLPLWDDFSKMESIYGPNTPSCYRRLRAFSGEMASVIGPRFVSVDLDVVVTGDLSPVWNRKEDFIIWGDRARQTPYNGSMWMMNAGAREKIWTEFQKNPERAVQKARGAGFFGSDQAWMCYMLGPMENRWTADDGVFSYRTHVKPARGALPKDARIVFFQGHYDPWHPMIREQCPWVGQHYR